MPANNNNNDEFKVRFNVKGRHWGIIIFIAPNVYEQ